MVLILLQSISDRTARLAFFELGITEAFCKGWRRKFFKKSHFSLCCMVGQYYPKGFIFKGKIILFSRGNDADRHWDHQCSKIHDSRNCLLYTSDAADERSSVDL